MAGVSAAEMLAQVNPDAIPADAPPDAANYREADVRGVSCMSCAKFIYTGSDENDIPKGYCGLWEANVQGDHVSDGFADAGPPLDENGKEIWDVGLADNQRVLNVFHFNEADTQVVEKGGKNLFRKAILRTGHWPFTPGPNGLAKRPLTITRDGQSDPEKGIISMAEVVANFKEGVLPHVPLTLSEDDTKEHPRTKANLTKWAKGFIRDVFIEDLEDGTAKLFADIEVTEPDTREKVANGTYADVSSGIPWGVMRKSDGKLFGAVLEHVTLTNNPFIDDLGTWALAASDDEEPVEVANYELDGEVTPPAEGDDHPTTPPPTGDPVEPQGDPAPAEGDPSGESEPLGPLSFNEQRAVVQSVLHTQLGLGGDYSVEDIRGDKAIVRNTLAETAWEVPFQIPDNDPDNASVSVTSEWSTIEGNAEPVTMSDPSRQLTPLEKARRLRELRLSQSHDNQEGGPNMSGFDMTALDGVELSDEARSGIQNILAENEALKKRDKEASATERIKELEGMGFDQRPGFLKLYRQVMLSDDGGPAAVLLSDDGKPQEQVTALTILDRAIDAIKGAEGKVEFSDQHTSSGNDDPPPATSEGENEPSVEDRVKATKAELGIK